MSAGTVVGGRRVELLTRASELARAEWAAGCGLLEVVAEWVVANPGDGLVPQRTRLEMASERAMVLAGDGTPTVAETAAATLGLEIGLSQWQACRLVADVLDLRYRLPRIWTLVQSHGVRPGHARLVAAKTRLLSVQQAAVVDAEVVGMISAVTYGGLLTAIDAAMLRADPQGARVRAETAARWRGVRVGRESEDGAIDVHARMDAPDGIALGEMVKRYGRLLRDNRDRLPECVPDRDPQSVDEWEALAVGLLRLPFVTCRVLLELGCPDLFDAAIDLFTATDNDCTPDTETDDHRTCDDHDSQGDHGRQPRDDHGPGDDRPGDAQPDGDQPYRDQPYRDQPGGDPCDEVSEGGLGQGAADHADVDRAAAGSTAGTQPGDGRPDEGQGNGGHHTDDHVDTDRAETDLTAAGPTDTASPGAGPTSDHPTHDQPDGDHPDDDSHDDDLTGDAQSDSDRDAARERALRALIRGIDPHKLLPLSVLHVHIDESAVRGDHAVARVEDLGPQLADTVRRWLRTGTRLHITPVIDPASVTAVDLYETPTWMREALLARNPRSVFPFSNRISRLMEMDHTIAYLPPPIGPPGQTGPHNLGPMATGEHRVKTFGTVRVRQVEPGTFIWHTETGRVIITNPAGTHDLGTGPWPQQLWHAATRPQHHKTAD
ncbi:hypothetical protein [Microlunatus soli]|uniref:DUF222 domain-containing protein n=1 Tax=Microlunatus soli TaxID=630515 RepID=A0A1H1Z748_9ACTN|nr:hypothetical protein [Microlunatus soli]SDT29490.1 hypothetical protein SAMN04489812_5025 [Microlunatus soli]